MHMGDLLLHPLCASPGHQPSQEVLAAALGQHDMGGRVPRQARSG